MRNKASKADYHRDWMHTKAYIISCYTGGKKEAEGKNEHMLTL